MHILPYTNGIYNMDVNTMDVFTNLGRQLSRQLGKEEEEVTRQLMQRLSIILARDNVGVMGSRIPALPPATVDHDIDL